MTHLKIFLLLTLTTALTACGSKPQENSSLDSSASDQSIVGGSASSIVSLAAKSTVALASPQSGVFCTAVLIRNNLVVTAAHCTQGLNPRQIFVVFSLTPNTATGDQIRQVLGGQTTETWPELTPNQEKNWGDIAVLKFAGSLPHGYEPAVILGNPVHLQDGMSVTLAGYGLTSMAPEVDPGKLMETEVSLTSSQFSETELYFAQDDGKGACHGDSGGPAYALINGRLELIGITSRSATPKGGATCLEGSVYTSIPAYRDFLVAAAKFLNSPAFVPGQPLPQPNIAD